MKLTLTQLNVNWSKFAKMEEDLNPGIKVSADSTQVNLVAQFDTWDGRTH